MKNVKHESGKKRKSQQLVASTDTPKLGIKDRKPLKRRQTKFNVENVSPNNKKHSPGSRQTVLSEYFTSPKASLNEPPACKKPTHSKYQAVLQSQSDASDETMPKMVNVPQLLSQLLRARVVLSRLPTPIKIQPVCTTTITDETENDLQSGSAVQRYCYKCKTLEIDYQGITKRKVCQRCGTLLIFVCTKCNTRHFIEHRHMMKHFIGCNGRVIDSSNTLDSVVLRFCADCPFKTTYDFVMDRHVKNTGHKVFDGEKVLEPDQLISQAKVLEDTRAQFIVKQNINSSRMGIKRFCKKCKKIVAGSRTIDNATCETCHTRLLYQCGKCRFKCEIYKFIYYHVKTKCYPTVYRCPKCQHTAPFWHMMKKHLKSRQCLGQIPVLSKRRKNVKN